MNLVKMARRLARELRWRRRKDSRRGDIRLRGRALIDAAAERVPGPGNAVGEELRRIMGPVPEPRPAAQRPYPSGKVRPGWPGEHVLLLTGFLLAMCPVAGLCIFAACTDSCAGLASAMVVTTTATSAICTMLAVIRSVMPGKREIRRRLYALFADRFPGNPQTFRHQSCIRMPDSGMRVEEEEN
jgi:hypothetical protein